MAATRGPPGSTGPDDKTYDWNTAVLEGAHIHLEQALLFAKQQKAAALFSESYEGVVVDVSTDHVYVIYDVDGDLVEQSYLLSHFSEPLKPGDCVRTIAQIVKLPKKVGTLEIEARHYQRKNVVPLPSRFHTPAISAPVVCKPPALPATPVAFGTVVRVILHCQICANAVD